MDSIYSVYNISDVSEAIAGQYVTVIKTNYDNILHTIPYCPSLVKLNKRAAILYIFIVCAWFYSISA